MIWLWLWISNNICLVLALSHARANHKNLVVAALLGYNLGILYVLWIYREAIIGGWNGRQQK